MQRKGIILASSVWGIVGIVLLLAFAIIRLLPFAYTLTHWRLDWFQWLLLVGWVAFMIYSEGVRAFGKQFSPRATARAQYLAAQQSLSWKRVLLAPLFCMGYFDAPKRRVVTAYCLTAGIIMLIILFHFVPQPWRGILDSGVVLGLAYGTATLLFFALKALRQPKELIADPEVI